MPGDNAGGGSDRGEDRCDYLEIEPEDEALVVFPSWLHHAVLPYFEEGEGRERVNIALNVNSLPRRS